MALPLGPTWALSSVLAVPLLCCAFLHSCNEETKSTSTLLKAPCTPETYVNKRFKRESIAIGKKQCTRITQLEVEIYPGAFYNGADYDDVKQCYVSVEGEPTVTKTSVSCKN